MKERLAEIIEKARYGHTEILKGDMIYLTSSETIAQALIDEGVSFENNKENIYFHISDDKKYGGFDFGVSAEVALFTQKQMQEFQSMLIAAIWAAHDMWLRQHDECASQETTHTGKE